MSLFSLTNQVIELPVKHPELFDALGIAQPKVHTSVRVCVCGIRRFSEFIFIYEIIIIFHGP